jgi:translation initiation factor IF-2
MSKIKIEEVALEAGANVKVALEKAKELGFKVRAKNSTINEQEAEILMNYLLKGEVPQELKKDSNSKKGNSKRVVVDKNKKESIVVDRQKKGSKETTATSNSGKKERDKENSSGKNSGSKGSRIKKMGKIQVIPKNSEPQKPRVVVDKESEGKTIRKRPGIIIRKKSDRSRDKVQVVKAVKDEEKKNSIKKIEKKSTPKREKQKRQHPQQPKDSGKKFEIDRKLGDSVEVFEEQEVMLLDFSDKTLLDDFEKKEQQKRDDGRKRAVMMGSQKNVVNRVQTKAPSSRKKKKRDYKKEKEQTKKRVDTVKLPEDVRVYEFAEKIGVSAGEVIKVLFNLGMVVTKNDFLDKDSIEILAEEFGVKVETINPLDELDYVAKYDAIPNKNEVEVPPVVTIMGHVDHGKTSLLDKIRQTKVAAKEAGGITQHVGAYQVEKDGKKITFIDTPGHSAFTEMRARGAQATDIAIIVVAADDGVMPQTKESISHAQAAGVPIIIAINKIDKPTANIDNVKAQMAEIGVTPVDWGGEYEFIPVSAHTGEGIDDLLETILLQAELMEIKADPTRPAKAIVLESSVEKGLGAVANIIVKNGTLRVGDNVIVGTTYGRVKSLILDSGKRAKEIGPSTPAALTGLQEVPNAGDILIAVDSPKEASEIANKRKELARAKELSRSTKVSIDELSELIAEGKIKKLPLIVKADVQGSLEAIKKALAELKNDEVEVNIIHSGVGAISESDVILADASEHALIVGFNVRPTGAVKQKAKELGIEIRTYNIIYQLIDDIEALLAGLMSPIQREEVTGQAEVRQTFFVSKVGTIAGCMVIDGKIERNAGARVIRNGVVTYTSKISSLKRFNDDVKEVTKGYECGLMIENFNDIKEGDIIEAFKVVEEKATL